MSGSPLPRARRVVPVASLAALLMLVPGAPSEARIPFGNGFGTAWVLTPSGRLDGFMTHVYAERTPGDAAIDLAGDSFAGVAIDGAPGVWLDDRAADSIAFEPGTGVLRVSHRIGPLAVESWWFAPWGLGRPGVALVARVTNEDPLSEHSVTIAALLRYAVGSGTPEASSKDEQVTLVGPSIFQEVSHSSRHRLVYRTLPTANQVALSPSDPYGDFVSLGVLTGGVSGGDVANPVEGDALALAFARGPIALASGAQSWLTVVSAYGDVSEDQELAQALELWVADRAPRALLDDELAAWRAWSGRDAIARRVADQGNVLVGDDELAVWTQALVSLRMSQVREPNDGLVRPAGQIVASLLPGPRQRSYPRDLAYAANALSQAGYADEAWDALSFVLNGHAGRLSAAVGADYAVSVSRYYGDATEDTRGEASPTTPSLGFDGFGLYLWALGEWADRQSSLARLEPHWLLIRERIAGALEAFTDPETGLVRADAGIWEYAGDARQHASTTIAAAVGLCAASRIASRMADPGAATRFAEHAQALREALLARLVDPDTGALAGNLQELSAGTARDASVVEAVNWGLIPADSALAGATLDSVGLLALGPGRGLARTDDPEDADRESVLADLRAAAALSASGRQFEADFLVERVVAQARARAHDQVPELLNPWGGPAGGMPMAGMGGAALGLARLEGGQVFGPEGCLPWTPPDASTPPDEEPDAGGELDAAVAEAVEPGPRGPILGPRARPASGCQSSGGSPALGLVASLLLLSAARRRRRA